MDDVDIAADYVERQLQSSLSMIPRYEGVSALRCLKCGLEIPENRRTVMCVNTCVDCAAEIERKRGGRS